MKFRISKEAFLAGLQQVQNVVSSRATLPILTNVHIEAEDNELRLTTTDLDLLVSGRTDCDVEKPGATTLPMRKLVGIVRELPAAEIVVTVNENHVATIKCGNSTFKLLGRDPSEFPARTEIEEGKEFKVAQGILKDGLKKTSYAISTDETRYVLNGIYCQFKANQMTLVATDGRRLAMADFDVEVPESQETSVIIPTKTVNELQRLLKDDGDINVCIGAKQVSFELNKNVVVSKLIEGNYPNFRQVIPGPAKHRVTLEREPFLETIQRISLLAQDKSNSVKVTFTKDNLDIQANAPDVGEAQESISVKYDGPDMAIAFNPEYLMAPFRNLDADELYLDLIDEVSPGVIKTNTPFLYVLMPMRVTA